MVEFSKGRGVMVRVHFSAFRAFVCVVVLLCVMGLHEMEVGDLW